MEGAASVRDAHGALVTAHFGPCGKCSDAGVSRLTESSRSAVNIEKIASLTVCVRFCMVVAQALSLVFAPIVVPVAVIAIRLVK